MPVTCGSLPDDALASILGGLSAQEAARVEATSKAFRRLRPRVVAAQRGHALRDAKVRLTVATDGRGRGAIHIECPIHPGSFLTNFLNTYHTNIN